MPSDYSCGVTQGATMSNRGQSGTSISSADDVVAALGGWSSGEGALYRQLADAIRGAIDRGDLRPGLRLPAERVLARSLVVSRTTVVAAYDELRRDGVLQSQQGSGTWIRRSAYRLNDPGRPSFRSSSSLRTLIEGSGNAIGFAVASLPGAGCLTPPVVERWRELLLKDALQHGYLTLG